MKKLILSLIMLLCFSGSIYSQNEENPWLFELGINSVNAEESNKSAYRLPSLSLSRYIFNNFSCWTFSLVAVFKPKWEELNQIRGFKSKSCAPAESIF